MRGKVASQMLLQHLERITPAYAGKSVSVQVQDAPYMDHPRLCGEKSF